MQLTEEVPGAGALARTGGKVTHTPHPPFFATSGPAKPRIVLLGEAWGQSEDECKRPFVGESGKELFRMLLEAMPQVAPELGAAICQQHKYGSAWVRDREQWLSEAGIAMTNVLASGHPGIRWRNSVTTKRMSVWSRPVFRRLRKVNTFARNTFPNLIDSIPNLRFGNQI